jgi:hypothetical protein
MTHDLEETNTLYINDGNGWFEDRTVTTGLGKPSQGFTGFGTVWLDFDNDGDLDLFVANGDVRAQPSLAEAGDPYPLHQKNQLFANLGAGRFAEVTHQAGKAFALSDVSRGAAVGDVDNDGDLDVLVANNSGPVRLLINTLGSRQAWFGLTLLDESNRPALGARVEVRRQSGPPIWRRVRSDGSYASANDPRVVVGLGTAGTLHSVRVHWPSGRLEEWANLPLRSYSMLREGEGKALD